MKYQLCFSIILLIICSCSQTIKTLDGKNDIQLNFAETTDTAFCNLDSIIPTDCGGGDFYFTNKGNVFYNFFCMGSDSISYSIGKYSITDSLVTCDFNQEYSYYNGEYGRSKDGSPIDPNSGKLKGSKKFTLKLRKTHCEVMKYYFLSDNKEIFVLRKPPAEGSIDFISAIKEIKVLSGM